VHPSTVVRRTDAGSAELAAPAHGLSLTQRRFLTLLDTACSVDELAQRHPSEADKLERDLRRLTTLGLVACEASIPANDATMADAANAPISRPPGAVRLGAPRAAKRIALVGIAVVGTVVAWAGWQQRPAPAPLDATRSSAQAAGVATAAVQDAAAVDPQPIATRVLRGDTADRARDASKDARTQIRSAEPRKEGMAPSVPAPLPVEHRSPAPHDAIDASLSRAPIPLAPSMPAPALLPMPVAPAATAPLPSPPGAPSGAKEVPLRVASAAPAAASLRPAPPPALVPIVRESPSFPREALAAGLDTGLVKARLTIDAKGNVESVDIVEASHRSFNRAVRDALARWRFEPGAEGRTTVVDVAFKRD
jgi:TonB family protein